MVSALVPVTNSVSAVVTQCHHRLSMVSSQVDQWCHHSGLHRCIINPRGVVMYLGNSIKNNGRIVRWSSSLEFIKWLHKIILSKLSFSPMCNYHQLGDFPQLKSVLKIKYARNWATILVDWVNNLEALIVVFNALLIVVGHS